MKHDLQCLLSAHCEIDHPRCRDSIEDISCQKCLDVKWWNDRDCRCKAHVRMVDGQHISLRPGQGLDKSLSSNTTFPGGERLFLQAPVSIIR